MSMIQLALPKAAQLKPGAFWLQVCHGAQMLDSLLKKSLHEAVADHASSLEGSANRRARSAPPQWLLLMFYIFSQLDICMRSAPNYPSVLDTMQNLAPLNLDEHSFYSNMMFTNSE